MKLLNYHKTTTISFKNGNEYKEIRLLKYNNIGRKATNKYYLNGKIQHGHSRYIIENIIIDDVNAKYLVKKWIK